MKTFMISLLVGSTYTLEYGWNNIVVKIFNVTPLSFWQVLSLTTLFSFITKRAESKQIVNKPKEDWFESALTEFLTDAMYIVFMAVTLCLLVKFI